MENLSLNQVIDSEITDNSQIPEIEPIIKVKGSYFAIRGDISFISGQIKSGKSNICQKIITLALLPEAPPKFDCLGFTVVPAMEKDVIYIDTEQPPPITNQARNRIKRNLDTPTQPSNLHFFNWRHLTPKQCKDAIELLFEKYTNTHLWIIDGVTDFVESANDETQGNATIRYFMKKASEHKTTIILLIHENPANGKLRGHIGSEAERKCGGSISIKKDKASGIHQIDSKIIRSSADFESVYFRWDDQTQNMVSVDEATGKRMVSNSQQKEDELLSLATEIFIHHNKMKRADLAKLIRQKLYLHESDTDKARKRADRIISNMVNKHIIDFDIATKTVTYNREIHETEQTESLF